MRSETYRAGQAFMTPTSVERRENVSPITPAAFDEIAAKHADGN